MCHGPHCLTAKVLVIFGCGAMPYFCSILVSHKTHKCNTLHYRCIFQSFRYFWATPNYIFKQLQTFIWLLLLPLYPYYYPCSIDFTRKKLWKQLLERNLKWAMAGDVGEAAGRVVDEEMRTSRHFLYKKGVVIATFPTNTKVVLQKQPSAITRRARQTSYLWRYGRQALFFCHKYFATVESRRRRVRSSEYVTTNVCSRPTETPTVSTPRDSLSVCLSRQAVR